MDYPFLKRFVKPNGETNFPDILDIDPVLTRLPYIVIPDCKIEPDDFDLFYKMWNERKMVANNLADIWELFYIYINPNLTDFEIRYGHPGPVLPGQYQDWSKYFPEMFSKIFSVMPFNSIDKISLASNVKRVPIHIDSMPIYYPWPNSVRVMISDTNDKPTFFLTDWPEDSLNNDPLLEYYPKINQTVFLNEVSQENKYYVDLPKNSNTFIYSNGAFLHGADYCKPKIMMLIWGTPNVKLWKQKLHSLLAKSQ